MIVEDKDNHHTHSAVLLAHRTMLVEDIHHYHTRSAVLLVHHTMIEDMDHPGLSDILVGAALGQDQ